MQNDGTCIQWQILDLQVYYVFMSIVSGIFKTMDNGPIVNNIIVH